MKYKINSSNTPHGSISWQHLGLDMQWAEAGTAVKLLWQCNAKWGLQEAHYTTEGGQVVNIDITVDVPQFVMPAENITIGGTFKRFVVQHWTEGKKGDIGSGDYVFVKGPNGEPMPLSFSALGEEISDSSLSSTSKRPVQNKVVKANIDQKQNTLVSGQNIKTFNGLSILGSGNLSVGSSDLSLAALGFPLFDASESYTAGDVVVYDGSLRIFTADHSGAWSDSDANTISLVDVLANGNIDILASDIKPKTETIQVFNEKFAMQTSGGDADLKNGASELLSIKGNLDASLNPFNATAFVSTGMNLVDPSQYITVSSKRTFIFPVAAAAWGQYGTTQENNGYIVFGTNIAAVYFKATKPTGASYGEACPTHVENGNTYYLPPTDGWLAIQCNTNDAPACHIAWSNYNDKVAGVFGNTVKDISTDVSWIHAWGMALISGSGRVVYDEIDLENGKRYRRTDRALLSGLTWTQEVADDLYIYTAPVTGMAVNGLWSALYSGLEVEGNTAVVKSTDISTIADLETALDGLYIYFELASAASASTTLSKASVVDDFGLTYFLNGGELATVAANVSEGFNQSGKDQLFNAVTYQKILAEVVATALCQLDSRLLAIENNIKNGFNYLKVTNLEVTRKLTQPA